ncbi:MAG TPA: hypothetical protein VMU35_04720, partial [Methylomirabilota bacterium]|nr:hypothetical protein [Methylomirabilota bacterium]
MEVENGATITAEDSQVTVEGVVETDGTVIFDCSLKAEEFRGMDGNLEVHGDLSLQDGLRISDGSLHVAGSLSARDVDVDKELDVVKDAKLEDLDVGGRVHVHGKLSARSVDVGGSLEVGDLVEVEDIDVGGVVRLLRQVKCRSIDV